MLACAPPTHRGADDAIAIVGVTVIDPASDTPSRADRTILVRGGVISAIGPSGTVNVPSGARRIDARGKFVVPGLWDTHVHFMNTGVTALPLLVANGVTSVREMGGFIDSTRAWQARMRAGTLVGPRIVTPGPVLESPRYLSGVRTRSERDPRLGQRILPYRLSVGDAAEAKQAIDSLVALHVDFVKFRTVASPEVYWALIREAHRAGLIVAGHQPPVPLRAMADSGQSDLEHAILPPLSGSSSETRDSVYRRFAERGTWYAPTLVVSSSVRLSGRAAYDSIFGAGINDRDPRRAYASPWLLEWWEMQVQERIADTSSARVAALAEAYRSSIDDTRRMRQLGVRILAGTDAGSVLIYPGASLHEELALLVEEAGFTPREALWSATIGPAQFAHLDRSLGRIASGMIADLLLLDADPLANIRNTTRIRAVMQAGRLFDRTALDALLHEVRRANASVPSEAAPRPR